jgi:hypothetical protein
MEWNLKRKLYRAVVARQTFELQRPDRDTKFEYKNAGRDLEAGYFHLQREEILPPYDYDTKQITSNQQGRQHSLLCSVRL